MSITEGQRSVNDLSDKIVQFATEHLHFHEQQVLEIEAAVAPRNSTASIRQERALVRERMLTKKFKAHLAIAESLCEALQNLEIVEPLPVDGLGFKSNTSIQAADIKGLPPEVIAQLNISESDQQEMAILQLFTIAGGELGFNNLIVALYRETGEIIERQKLTGKIYRMIGKGMLFAMPGKKAIYNTTEYTEEIKENPEESND